jgi:1-acyl-sn-glycerol-3-phosphate acyltransferase
MVAMSKFADYLNEHKRSAVIFPEGTRSRTGAPKKFAVKGLQLLIEKMPEALVVPITINNSWKLFRYGNFPMGIGVHFFLKVHEPIAANSQSSDALVAQVERTITADII